jgi:hypothetical protein
MIISVISISLWVSSLPAFQKYLYFVGVLMFLCLQITYTIRFLYSGCTPEILILWQLDKVYKCFMAMHSEGKPMTGTMIIEKSWSFHDEMKIADKCTFVGGQVQSKKKLPVRNYVIVGSV